MVFTMKYTQGFNDDLFKQDWPRKPSKFGPLTLPDGPIGYVQPPFLAVACSGILDTAPTSYGYENWP